MTSLFDWLFRVGVYRGTEVRCVPDDLIHCVVHQRNYSNVIFSTEINQEHGLAEWLLHECEGPWTIRMRRPLNQRVSYLAFARVPDAVTFRLLLP